MENIERTIFKEHWDKAANKNIAELARNISAPYSSMFHTINNGRQWRVDQWLLTLQQLGALTFEGDKIIIKSKKLKNISHA